MAESLEQLLKESKHLGDFKGPGGLPPLTETPFCFAGTRIYEILTKETRGGEKQEPKKES